MLVGGSDAFASATANAPRGEDGAEGAAERQAALLESSPHQTSRPATRSFVVTVAPYYASTSMTAADWSAIATRLRQRGAAVGLDLVHPFPVGAYNAAVPGKFRIEDFGQPDRLAVVFGNTRALWRIFLAALQAEPELAQSEHPLERYLEQRVGALLNAIAPRDHALYWAHHTKPRALPIQRLAELAGLATLAPSHLSIHPTHGPWFALRAVAVIDIPGPASPTAPSSPCATCSKPCLPALERALALTGAELGASGISRHADAWIAVRDACPLGTGSRYSEAQLRYHYTKDRSFLR